MHVTAVFLLLNSNLKGALCEKGDRKVCSVCEPRFLWSLSSASGVSDVFCRGMGAFHAGRRLSIQLDAVSGDPALPYVSQSDRAVAGILESWRECDRFCALWGAAPGDTKEKDEFLESCAVKL